MKAIYHEEMEHRLKERFPLPCIHHVTLLTHGIPESEMAIRISDWEAQLPGELKLAYLPSPGLLRLRITGKSAGTKEELITLMEKHKMQLLQIIGPQVFGYGGDKLEEIVGRMLKEKGYTLSVAESCTGGAISGMITSVSGSSAYFKGSLVAYSNDIKTSELNVSPMTLMMNGAVSQAVVEQMADGIRSRFGTDFSVSVSGVAGPTGGTAEKPVGTTWISVASRKRTISRMFSFGEDRGRNIQKAAIAALFLLRNEIRDCL
jgi:nicotinamide-nucleotide amidase